MERTRREAERYCRTMLPRVSRTFALDIGLLPQPLGAVVRQAYLFCRIADTVEDSQHLQPDERPALLAQYRTLFGFDDGWEAEVEAWSRRFAPLASHGDDAALCAAAPLVFRAFAALPSVFRPPVVACVREMTTGMERFARRRARAGSLHLETVAELEEYCHYAAGTVGTMLCDLFAIARPGWSDTRLERMRRLAPRFGLALQLTNILQDVEDDARRGNFFVPRTVAADHRLRPDEMLDPARREPALAVVRDLARHAARACDAALEFTLLIPRRDMRLRLFCLWPLFLAIRTLSLAVRSERRFETGTRPRVGRAEVRWCLGRALVRVASNDALRRLYASEILRLDPRLA